VYCFFLKTALQAEGQAYQNACPLYVDNLTWGTSNCPRPAERSQVQVTVDLSDRFTELGKMSSVF